jgi:hypothetical protein
MAFIAPVLVFDQQLLCFTMWLLGFPLVIFVMSIEFIKNVEVPIWTPLVWFDFSASMSLCSEVASGSDPLDVHGLNPCRDLRVGHRRLVPYDTIIALTMFPSIVS